ncbi:hypothetical protein GCM10010124_25640 [Pilimelia terevasa]|uniref:Uncharacterized protein n=1 Tax=Pilimelia terevasa TaxID=53372 RepID=A0A8J3FK54_9ACTN|nr:hypothetical protein GCM10010124_25640 [Pilimelia terevasa]
MMGNGNRGSRSIAAHPWVIWPASDPRLDEYSMHDGPSGSAHVRRQMRAPP